METKRIYLYIKDNKHEFTEKLPDKPKDKTRLFFISDTHEKHELLDNIPKANILIHSGDILYQGRKYLDSISLKNIRNLMNGLENKIVSIN